jgi:hypothetical protein
MQRTTVLFASALLGGAIAGCVGCDTAGRDGEDGLQGEAGPAGEPGDPAERTVHRSTFSSYSDVDDGTIADRELTFNKAEESTMLRLTYYDSFTVNGSTGALYGCRWMLLFNGRPCTDPGPIAGNVVGMGSTISSFPVSGWCTATDDGPLGAGEITVTVNVGTIPGVSGLTAGDCITGMGEITGFIEAEELD